MLFYLTIFSKFIYLNSYTYLVNYKIVILFDITIMKRIIILLITLVLIILGIIVYKQLTYTHITVQFKELRPHEKNLPVYYKGIIIGKAGEKKHTDDYQHTLMKVVLYPKNLHLPINTEVELRQIVKNRKTKDYLELLYPENPSTTLISNGTYLKGYATVGLETFAHNQRIEDLEAIKQNLKNASENLNTTIEALGGLFVLLQDVVNENRSNLKGTTNNIRKVSSNINSASIKVNNSIKQEELESIVNTINRSSNNVERITESVYDTSVGINKSIPNISSTINETQNLIANTNAISCGVRQTLRKHFGGLRLIFGRSIKEAECKPCGR